jgi:hypothetical protein
VVRFPVYDYEKHGNVFEWLIKVTPEHREMRKAHENAVKEAAAESQRLGDPKVENS